jgi:hypothetical protein
VLPELCPEILVLPTLADIFSASKIQRSVADPNPGSIAFLAPGSGIRNMFFRISDPKPMVLKVCKNYFGYRGGTTVLFEWLIFGSENWDKGSATLLQSLAATTF